MWMGCDWSKWCVLDESGKDDVECRRNEAGGSKVAGPIKSLVNARGLQLKLERVQHE